MSVSLLECPICKEKFRYRFTLRHHLSDKHTDHEAEKYISKFLDDL